MVMLKLKPYHIWQSGHMRNGTRVISLMENALSYDVVCTS